MSELIIEQIQRAVVHDGDTVIFFADGTMLRGRITWLLGDEFGYLIPPFPESSADLRDVVRVVCID